MPASAARTRPTTTSCASSRARHGAAGTVTAGTSSDRHRVAGQRPPCRLKGWGLRRQDSPARGAQRRLSPGTSADVTPTEGPVRPPVCEHMFVRWEHRRSRPTTHGRLPGYRDDGVVRRFDAPRRWTRASTRSAPSRRSTASRARRGMPFAGRSTRTADAPMPAPTASRRHADPDGRRADASRSPSCASGTGSTAPCGEGRTGATSSTEVLAHWSTVKPAYRVTLEDGTELVASGDHRFLTRARLEARHRRRAGRRPAPAPHARTTSCSAPERSPRRRATTPTTGAATSAA